MNRTAVVVVAALAAIGVLWWMLGATESGAVDPDPQDESIATGAVAAERSRSRSRVPDDGDAQLAQRVAKLEKQVALLQRQLGMRRAAEAMDRRGDERGDEDSSDAPQFADGVRAVLEEEKEKDRERWIEARREGWEEMTNEILDELDKDVGLSTEHRDALYQAWSAEADQILPLVMQARSGESSWRETRDQIEEIRSETDATAKDFLSEEQYAAYQESRPRPGPRRGGRGGRGGRAGSPPP